MRDTGILWCAAPESMEVSYSIEAFWDDPRSAIIEIEVVSGERSLMYVPQLMLHSANGQRFNLTVIAYDVALDALSFQARGTLVEEEETLERAA